MDSLKPELQKSLNDVIQAIRDGVIPLKYIVDSIIPVRVKLTKAQRIEKKKEYYKQWSEKHSDYWRVYNNKKKLEAAARKKIEDGEIVAPPLRGCEAVLVE